MVADSSRRSFSEGGSLRGWVTRVKTIHNLNEVASIRSNHARNSPRLFDLGTETQPASGLGPSFPAYPQGCSCLATAGLEDAIPFGIVIRPDFQFFNCQSTPPRA